jgi:myo-inositol catabolism protein IolC
MDRQRVYMLAADHRWQWEEWCDANGVARTRIPEAKALALAGLLRARERSERIRRWGALLLDERYASASIRRAQQAGVVVGTPAEAAGVFPLRFSSEPFSRDLTGGFVKVLVRHRPDQPQAVQQEQLRLLLELQAWCREQARPLVVEVLVPTNGEAASELEARRPGIVADYVRAAYAKELEPEFWKLEGMQDAAAAGVVDRAITERPRPRLLILGKGAGIETVAHWFAAVRGCATAAGFAIGRTAYWEAAARHLQGQLPADAAADEIATCYERLVALWDGEVR